MATTAFIPKRPIGALRGTVLGFLSGVCIVSGAGFYVLFDRYTTASRLLLESVSELKASSVELQGYARRLEQLEGRMNELSASMANKTELAAVKRDSRSLYDELNLSHLDVKRAIWSLEEDTKLLLDERARTVRV